METSKVDIGQYGLHAHQGRPCLGRCGLDLFCDLLCHASDVTAGCLSVASRGSLMRGGGIMPKGTSRHVQCNIRMLTAHSYRYSLHTARC